MRLDKIWKLAGNLDRIEEMKSEGFGYNAIAGIFTDNGIPMTAQQVQTIHEVAPLLQNKGLEKKVVKDLVKKSKENPKLTNLTLA